MIRYNAQSTIRNLLFVYIKCNLQQCSRTIIISLERNSSNLSRSFILLLFSLN